VIGLAVMSLAQSQAPGILSLENGDRLTRAEFERRYRGMSDVKKAELIEGIVYMASPVRARRHGRPHAAMMGWLSDYWVATPGVELLDNPTVRLDGENEPQPDACLRLEEGVGGRSWITDDDYIEGSPELMVEVAASSASYDLHDKKRAYQRNGVQEYVVWRVDDRIVDWFVLEDGIYVPLVVDGDGLLRSRVFPGLWLAVTDLLEGDLIGVMAKGRMGLESAEYQEFQRRLRD
jgi:Uma2 family endonuclease